MALFNRVTHKQSIDINKTMSVVKSQEHSENVRGGKGAEMRITVPSLLRALVSAVEFTVFTVVSGACCWGLSWVVTDMVAWWVHHG